MIGHTAQTLREQLEQIDRLLTECEGRPMLERFVASLRDRREATIRAMKKIEQGGGG